MANFKRESFGEIPKRDVIAKLVRYYRWLEYYLQNNIFNIDVYNYTRKAAINETVKLEKLMKTFNEQVFDYFELNITKTYLQAKRKVDSRIQNKFKKRKSKTLNSQGVIDKQLMAVTKTFLKANNSIIKTAKQYFKLLDTAQTGINKLPKEKLQLQEFSIDDIRDEVQFIVKTGVRDHIAQGYVKRDIKDYLLKLFEGQSTIQVGGKIYKPHKYAELLARTEMRTAQTNATLVSCKEFNVDLVRFSVHASPCKICAPLEGDIYSIGGKHPRYPSLDAGVAPPVHPNCEHNLDPYDELQELIA